MNISNHWKSETTVSTAAKDLTLSATGAPLVSERCAASASSSARQPSSPVANSTALPVERVDEFVELEAIRVGVALEEEGQGRLGGVAVAAGVSTLVALWLPARTMPCEPKTSMRWS